MNYQALKQELDTDPLSRGYAGMTDAEVAADLNAATITEVRERWVNARTIYTAFADPAEGEAVLSAIEGQGASNTVLKRAARWLAPEAGGIDVGHTQTRAMLDQLAAGGVISPEQAATIKALAEHQVSRAQQLGLGRVDWRDVRYARSL